MISHKCGSHRWALKCHTKTHSCELICHTLRLALRFPLRFAFRFLGSSEIGHADALYGMFTRRTLFIGVQGPGRALRQAVKMSECCWRDLPHPTALKHCSREFTQKSAKKFAKKSAYHAAWCCIATWKRLDPTSCLYGRFSATRTRRTRTRHHQLTEGPRTANASLLAAYWQLTGAVYDGFSHR